MKYLITVGSKTDANEEYIFLLNKPWPSDIKEAAGSDVKQLIKDMYLGDAELSDIIKIMSDIKDTASKIAETAKGTVAESLGQKLYSEATQWVDAEINAAKNCLYKLEKIDENKIYSIEVEEINK